MEDFSVLENTSDGTVSFIQDSSGICFYRYTYPYKYTYTYSIPLVICPHCGSQSINPTMAYHWFEDTMGEDGCYYTKHVRSQEYLCNDCGNSFFVTLPAQ